MIRHSLARALPVAALALVAGCQLPGLTSSGRAPRALSVRTSVLPDGVVVEWDETGARGVEYRLAPVRVRAGGVLEEGRPRPVSGGRATASRAELDEGTWRFRLSATDAAGGVLADELSPPVTIEPDYPSIDFLTRADLGLAEGFDVPTLLTFPAWGTLREGGHYDAGALAHARRELEQVMRAAVECSLGGTYPASLTEVQRVEKARDVLAPRGGDPAVLTHALRAKSLLVFDLRLPEPTGTVPSQLVARVYDLTYRRYDQELLKLLNTRPLVYEDYVELDYDPAPDADNTGALLDAYGRIAAQMLEDEHFRQYFEMLETTGDALFVDEASQDVLLRALGRKLADVQRDEGRAANHRRIERDLLFTRRPVIEELPPADLPAADPPLAGDLPAGDPPADPFSAEAIPQDATPASPPPADSAPGDGPAAAPVLEDPFPPAESSPDAAGGPPVSEPGTGQRPAPERPVSALPWETAPADPQGGSPEAEPTSGPPSEDPAGEPPAERASGAQDPVEDPSTPRPEEPIPDGSRRS